VLGEVGEADGFRYQRRALIYQPLAGMVDIEVIRELV
jgi:hypothetical protein